MAIVTQAEALQKRNELVEMGYCVVPAVLRGEVLQQLRDYTDSLFDRKQVDPKYRYQGSDFHIASKRLWEAGRSQHHAEFSPLVDRLVDLPEAWEACRLIGLENQRPDDSIIVLSKPPFGPPLYWHQDMMNWNHPEAASPWPTRVFLSYYMTDTTIENGCLRAIPGTHRKRIPLHDLLPAAHGTEIQAIEDLSDPVFMDHPDAVDLPVCAGDLVINDARLLHAARANNTDQRRTLVLQWHSLFAFPNPPSWWRGEVPQAILDYDPSITYAPTRTPSKHLPDFRVSR